MSYDDLSYEYLRKYLTVAPVSLSLVRGLESTVFQQIKLVPPILDIGCGDGLFARITFTKQIDVGIDINFKEIKRAYKSGKYKMVINATVTDIPFPDNYFNTVISNCVFEHIAPINKAFKEIYRVLKPGGFYAFTAHSHYYEDFLYYPCLLEKIKMNFLAEIYKKFIRKIFKHFNCLAPEVWTEKLQSAGFKNIKYQYYLPKITENTFDLLLPLSSIAYINKKLFGKWVVMPRNYVWKLMKNYLKKVYKYNCQIGGALFIQAFKI